MKDRMKHSIVVQARAMTDEELTQEINLTRDRITLRVHNKYDIATLKILRSEMRERKGEEWPK